MPLNFVSEQLLAANKLNYQHLYQVLGQLSERKLSYADLYFQSNYHEAWIIEDSIVKEGIYHIDQGSEYGLSVAKKQVLLMQIKLH